MRRGAQIAGAGVALMLGLAAAVVLAQDGATPPSAAGIDLTSIGVGGGGVGAIVGLVLLLQRLGMLPTKAPKDVDQMAEAIKEAGTKLAAALTVEQKLGEIATAIEGLRSALDRLDRDVRDRRDAEVALHGRIDALNAAHSELKGAVMARKAS